MQLSPLPFRSSIEAYEAQADQLLDAFRAGDRDAIDIFWHKHPRFLDDKVPWLPKRIPVDEVRSAPLDQFDARLAVARWYDFQDWRWLRAWVEAVTNEGSPVALFESAVEAVINGDAAALSSMLRAHPGLVRERSTRINGFDPPMHRATLLHYIAANGAEGYRQKSPPNAVQIAKLLLEAGAEPDALASMYGSECTTMSMLVSSTPPAQAGVQVPLVETLIDFGAAVDDRGKGAWTSPLMTALVFGFRDAAETLVRRGACVDTIAAAAGLGRLDQVRQFLPSADADDRHRSLALAAQLGHVDVVRLLLDAGEDPNRYNPPATHGHATPLHQAIAGGRDAVVHLLVERGARLDIKDTIFQGTPLGWAEYCQKPALAEFLRAHGAP
jgi:ankyrin repeat protein